MQKKYLVIQIKKERKTIIKTDIDKIYETLTDIFFYEDIFTYSKEEYFIDITNYQDLYQKTPYQLAQNLKKEIIKKNNLKVKIGLGTNIFLAKTACDIITKIKKISIAYLDEKEYILTCSKHKPLNNFWQISNSMMLKLKKLKIETMEDIRNCSYEKLYEIFGYNAEYLINHSLGLEAITIKDLNNKKLPKSISSCSKFETVKSKKETTKELIELLDFNILKLKEKSLYTKNIYLYIKYANNIIPKETITINLSHSTNSYITLMNSVLKIYNNKINLFIPIEKIAISFGKITKKEENPYTSPNKKKNTNKVFSNILSKKKEISFLIHEKISFLHT